MKLVYTPKKGKFAKTQIHTDKYISEADRELSLKKRNQLTSLKKEIIRRQTDNYHLDT